MSWCIGATFSFSHTQRATIHNDILCCVYRCGAAGIKWLLLQGGSAAAHPTCRHVIFEGRVFGNTKLARLIQDTSGVASMKCRPFVVQGGWPLSPVRLLQPLQLCMQAPGNCCTQVAQPTSLPSLTSINKLCITMCFAS